jgi:hypothetical protein
MFTSTVKAIFSILPRPTPSTLRKPKLFSTGISARRVGAALTFLEGNEVLTDADPMLIHDAMIAIAEKRMSKKELAALFRRLFHT